MSGQRRRDAHWFWTAASFLAGLLLALGIFAVIGLAPFGERILFMSDLSAQYMPFLAFFRDSLAAGEGWLYSFQNGIGGNMIPLIAYYLTSPLNLLILPFANADLPMGIHLLMVLKLALASGTMGWYLSRTYDKRGMLTVVFSAGYAFSGFTAAYFYNIMWLDALIWLPLVVYALQQLIERGRKLPYIFCLFAAIISNYYLGYMICLFLVLYVVYWTRKRQLRTPWGTFVRENRQVWLNFLVSSLLAGMMTALMLVPTVFGMLSTGKGEFDFAVFLPQALFGLDGLAGFGLAVSDFTSRLDHLPTFYVGLLPLLLATTYFSNTHIRREESRLLIGFLLVLLACTGLQTLVAVFQMFQEAAGFPFRNSFLFSFVLLQAGYESWNNREGISSQLILRNGGLIAIGLLVGYMYNHFAYESTGFPQLQWRNLLLSLIFLGMAALLLAGILAGRKHRTWLIMGAAVLTLAELGLNFRLTMRGMEWGNLQEYQAYVEGLEKELEGVGYQADSLIRIDNTWLDTWDLGVATNGYNEGMHFGYNSVASYSSTLSSGVVEWFQQMGTYSRNERRFSYLGSTPLTDLLLNVGYGFTMEEGTIDLFEREAARGIGFAIPEEAADLELENREPFANQNKIFQRLYGGSEDVFQPVSAFSLKQEGNTFAISLEASAPGELYAWLPRLGGGKEYKEVHVDGRKVEPKLFLTNDTLLPLGEVAEGQLVEVTLEAPAEVTFNQEDFQLFNTSLFQQRQKEADLSTLEDVEWERNELTGTLAVKDQDLLYLAIPYDEGWQAEVNGEEVKVREVLGGFLGVPLQAGTNRLRVRYIPAGFPLGLALSSLALAGSIVWGVLPGRLRKKRQAEAAED